MPREDLQPGPEAGLYAHLMAHVRAKIAPDAPLRPGVDVVATGGGEAIAPPLAIRLRESSSSTSPSACRASTERKIYIARHAAHVPFLTDWRNSPTLPSSG